MGNFGASRSSHLIVGSQGCVSKAKVPSADLPSKTSNSLPMSWTQSSMTFFARYDRAGTHVVGMMLIDIYTYTANLQSH